MPNKGVSKNYYNIPSSLNNDEVLVYYALCKSTNFTLEKYKGRERFECFCSKRTLSLDTGIGDKKVLSILKALEEKGYIKLISKGKPPRTPSKYKMIYAESIKKVEPLKEPITEPLSEPFQRFVNTNINNNYEPLKEPLNEPLEEPPSKDISKDNTYSENYIEEIWKLYPYKKGRDIAIKKIPKLLKEHGRKEIIRCIERYIKDVDYIRKNNFKTLSYKNGSTFFNSGYVDYLDCNYEDIKVKEIQEPVEKEIEEDNFDY